MVGWILKRRSAGWGQEVKRTAMSFRNNANGKSAGNIDVVLVAYDEHGKIYDFGALEIQAVYVTNTIEKPF